MIVQKGEHQIKAITSSQTLFVFVAPMMEMLLPPKFIFKPLRFKDSLKDGALQGGYDTKNSHTTHTKTPSRWPETIECDAVIALTYRTSHKLHPCEMLHFLTFLFLLQPTN